VEQPEMEGADMELAKVWSSQMTWNPMLCEKDHTFISGDKYGMSSEREKSEILTIQDEECGQSKRWYSRNLKEGNYSAMCQEVRARLDADCYIEPHQISAVGPAFNIDGGTECILAYGLRVIVRQGSLVDVDAEVIVNPANSELSHRGGAARAISVADGK